MYICSFSLYAFLELKDGCFYYRSPEVAEGDDQSLCGPDSSPAGPQVEPESGGQQDESAPGTIGAFSGFFSGIASVVEQRVSYHTL